MDIQTILQIIRKNWWLVLLLTLISAGAAAAFSFTQQNVYESSATFVANPSLDINTTGDKLYSLDTLGQRESLVNTTCHVMSSQRIFDQAVQSLSTAAAATIGYDVSCVVLPNSNVLRVQVQGFSPDNTADLANAIGIAGIDYIDSLYEVYELRPLDAAYSSPSPIAPNHMLNIIFGVVIGLIAGLAVVVLRHLLAYGVSQPAVANAS